MSIIWPKYAVTTINTTTDSTTDSSAGNNYTVDTGTLTVDLNNAYWTDTTGGTGNITIDYNQPTFKFPIDEEAEVYISSDVICLRCAKPLGMVCEKGHYIQSDKEEYRFVHSLKCNKKLALKFRAIRENQVNKVYHAECPEDQ